MRKYIRRNWLGILLVLSLVSTIYRQISIMGTVNGIPFIWLPVIAIWLWWREDHQVDKQEKSCAEAATSDAAKENNPT